MPITTDAVFSTTKLSRASELVHALSHAARLEILQILQSEGDLNLQELQQYIQLDPSTITQHLRLLRQAGLLETRKVGRFITYSLVESKYQSSLAAVAHFNEVAAEIFA